MVGFVLVVSAIVLVGDACIAHLWRRWDLAGWADVRPAERATAAALTGGALWFAIQWALALTHVLVRPALALAAGAFVLAAVVLVVKRRGTFHNRHVDPARTATLLVLLPLLVWLIFVLWRGVVLPPASHDVLAYHLPKAVLMERAHGFVRSWAPDARIVQFPDNYELLLADVLILTGSDTITEWIGTLTFVLLLIATAAIAQRWTRGAPYAGLATALAVATAPVLLLHSGADKNDLLTTWFTVSALLWGSRWIASGGRAPMLLTIVALGLGFGTKSSVAAIGVGLAPLLLVAMVRRLRAGTLRGGALVMTAGAGVVTFLLGGGVSYLANYFGPSLGDSSSAATARSAITTVAYGDWQNLWQVPYLLLTVPFSRHDLFVWVPWRQQRWFWPHYEIYFSHYGALVTLLLLTLPFTIRAYRRAGDDHSRRERFSATFAALIALAIMLPVQLRPVGFFGAFARYCAFALPLAVCWTLPPLIAAAEQRSRRLTVTILAALALVFTFEAWRCATRDRFAPVEYVRYAAAHRGTRVVWFEPNRAASLVDRVAGPNDVIAIDGGFETWTYPAYGANRTRPVIFLRPGVTPAGIPPGVQWVIIDRSWNKLWDHPKMTDLGQLTSYFGKGTPTDDDVRLERQLRAAPDFRLVVANERLNQAVFVRIAHNDRALPLR